MYAAYNRDDLTAEDEADKKIISSMIRDLEYVIKWLETGRNPDSRRGIDKHGAYTMDPQILDRIKIQKPKVDVKELPIHQKVMIEEAIDGLTEKERDAFLMIRVEGLTYEYAAELMNIKKTSIQNHLQRAEKKIEKRKKGSLFLVG